MAFFKTSHPLVNKKGNYSTSIPQVKQSSEMRQLLYLHREKRKTLPRHTHSFIANSGICKVAWAWGGCWCATTDTHSILAEIVFITLYNFKILHWHILGMSVKMPRHQSQSWADRGEAIASALGPISQPVHDSEWNWLVLLHSLAPCYNDAIPDLTMLQNLSTLQELCHFCSSIFHSYP